MCRLIWAKKPTQFSFFKLNGSSSLLERSRKRSLKADWIKALIQFEVKNEHYIKEKYRGDSKKYLRIWKS